MRSVRNLRPATNLLLNSIFPGCGEIYSKRFASSAVEKLIRFTEIKMMSKDDAAVVASGLRGKLSHYPKGQSLDLSKSKILQVSTEDIELTEGDKTGDMIVVTKDDLEVSYGEKGRAASRDVPPEKLLTKKYVIPGGSLGVLNIAKHVPFKLNTANANDAVAIATCQLSKVPTVEENVKRYSLDVITELPADLAKRAVIKIQGRIFEDRRNENFYEEVTSKVFSPTDEIRSSGTLMNFERRQFGIDNTTDMHYHPGERALIIFTTDKEAGVTLNFCGVEENPDHRKDCEVTLNFPTNSYLVLTFPPHTHHKFRGEFVCMSIHPREGQNIIDAVKSGTLPRGFLESATAFSRTGEEVKWEVSTSSTDTKGKDNSQGR